MTVAVRRAAETGRPTEGDDRPAELRYAPPRMLNARTLVIAAIAFAAPLGCGGSSQKPADGAGTAGASETPATKEELAAAVKPCGEKDKVHTYDLHDPDGHEILAPCAGSSGGHDYSGLIKLETVEGGVHILIDAKDDEVTLLGPDAKTRDAVIVYPKGKDNTQKAVEIPLIKTKTGYHGDKIIFWEDLGDKITDEGTNLHVAIFDHDKDTGSHEALHVSVNISAGKSCERAIDENPQTIDMGGGKKGGKADLTNDQLGAPMKTSAFISGCNLADSADADICVAVKQGKPLGVTVKVSPQNNKVAACIDRATRRLAFPSSEKLDVVHQKF